MAASRGGRLLSFEYNGNRSPLQWECGKGRPTFLQSLKTKPKELDGYCPELQLAFEHYGEQR